MAYFGEIKSYLKEKMNYHGQVIDVISSKENYLN